MKNTSNNRVRFAEILNTAIYNENDHSPERISLIEILPILDEYRAAVEALPARSAWVKGVKEYAFELLENFGDQLQYAVEVGETLPELSEKKPA